MKVMRLPLLLGLAIFFIAWQRVEATRLGFRLEQSRRAVLEAKSRNSYLRLELQRLTAPDALSAAARQKLGMLPPGSESLVFLAETAERPLLLSWLKTEPQIALR